MVLCRQIIFPSLNPNTLPRCVTGMVNARTY